MSITSTLTAIGAAGAGGDINFVYEATYSVGDMLATALCFDNQDNIIVTGHLGGGTYDEVYVLKLDKNGNKLWDKIISLPQDCYPPMDGGLDVDSNDNIYLCVSINSTDANWLWKLDSDGNFNASVKVSNISEKANVGVSSADNVFVAGGYSGAPGFVATEYDTSLNDTWSYYWRSNDTRGAYKFLRVAGNTLMYVLAPHRTSSNFHPYRVSTSTGFSQADPYMLRVTWTGPTGSQTFTAEDPVSWANSNSYDWFVGVDAIDTVYRAINYLRYSSGITASSSGGATYHSDNNAWLVPYTAEGYGTTSGLMVGGEKRFGANPDYAFIMRNATPNGNSSTRQTIGITHSSFTAVKTVSIKHNSANDFIVAAIGESTTNKTTSGTGTGFIVLKVPTFYTASDIAGTYGNTTLADRTGELINVSGTITTTGADTLTNGTRNAVAPSTYGSIATATNVSETLTEIQELTMYIKVNNGVTENYTIGQLRRDNPNTSFPRSIPVELLSEYRVYPVTDADRPSIDNRTQRLTRNEQATQVNGAWVYEWTVTDKTAEEIAQYDADEAKEIRATRDEKLTKSDWTQVADAPVDKAAWATYRQALRDIPSQAGFPNTIDWPTQP